MVELLKIELLQADTIHGIYHKKELNILQAGFLWRKNMLARQERFWIGFCLKVNLHLPAATRNPAQAKADDMNKVVVAVNPKAKSTVKSEKVNFKQKARFTMMWRLV